MMFFILSKLVERFTVPSNLVIMLGAIGIVLLILKWRRLGLGFCLISILLLGLGGMTPVGDIALATLENRFPMPDLKASPTGIIMLGGAVDIHISSARHVVALKDSAERVTETAALANRYPQARIFLSGGVGHIVSTGLLTESALARDLLLTLNIPSNRISMEEKSRTTAENAAYSFESLQPKSGEVWLLVTSASHMPRAVAAFRAVGFSVIPYPVDYRTHGEDHWDFPDSVADGFEELDLAAHEWIGLVAYRLAGKTDSVFPSP
jgi:uncharacterized SAM-binding protein YcdF (DUF218 family)